MKLVASSWTVTLKKYCITLIFIHLQITSWFITDDFKYICVLGSINNKNINCWIWSRVCHRWQYVSDLKRSLEFNNNFAPWRHSVKIENQSENCCWLENKDAQLIIFPSSPCSSGCCIDIMSISKCRALNTGPLPRFWIPKGMMNSLLSLASIRDWSHLWKQDFFEYNEQLGLLWERLPNAN